MFNLSVIFISMLVPVSVSLTSVLMAISIYKNSPKMADNHYTIFVPKLVMLIGCMVMITGTLLCICFTIFSSEYPHWIFYVVCFLIFILGFYLFFKTVKWRVIVEGDKITVYPLFSKRYSLLFSEIKSAKREVKKKNNSTSERIIVISKADRKFIVESVEVSYKRFLNQLKCKVDPELLDGFDI